MIEGLILTIGICLACTIYIALSAVRLNNLHKYGKTIKAKVTKRPLFLSFLRQWGLKTPDVNNGIYLIEYRFKDKNGKTVVNASYVSRRFYNSVSIGDDIDIRYDQNYNLNNKPVVAIDRDLKTFIWLVPCIWILIIGYIVLAFINMN